MPSTNAPARHLPRYAAWCGVTMVSRYEKRVSGPLLDRSAQPPFGMGPAEIRDLAGSEQIQTAHIAEAIQYRPRRQV
jgi:predicted ATPase with chaperone activity